MREIGTEAFCKCRRLGQVTFAEEGALEKIVSRAFACTAVRQVRFPSGLKELGELAFYGC